MKLWGYGIRILSSLRDAFPRTQTFYWFACAVCGFCTRCDLAGVTSFVRCLNLENIYYDRLLDMFHSKGLNFRKVRVLWWKAVLKFAGPMLWTVNGRIVLLGDGVKNPKSGKQMPGVKKLHQESDSNTKPEFIFGHLLQAISVVVNVREHMVAIPIGAEIHDGVVFSNRCKKTLMDKLLDMLCSIGIECPAYFVLDAYYGAEKMIRGTLKQGHHLVTRMKSNAVAYETPMEETKRRGRKRVYGQKIKLRSLFNATHEWFETELNLYGKLTKIRFFSKTMLWRYSGC
ncbi:MAG: transposase [Victivallaceae bacterium]|nr:transposase [Victivallaceae bacterium]